MQLSELIAFSLKSSVLRGVGGLGQKISRCFTSLSSYVRVVYPFHLASLSAYSCILCQARVVLSFTGLPTWNFWDTGWKIFYPRDGKLSALGLENFPFQGSLSSYLRVVYLFHLASLFIGLPI